GVDDRHVGNALHLDEGGFIDHGDQDAVDHETGSLVDLHGGLADLGGDLFDGLHGLGGGVDTGDDLDELHAVGGVEEVHADHGTGQALADLGDGQSGGDGGNDALRLAALLQRGAGVLLALQVREGVFLD